MELWLIIQLIFFSVCVQDSHLGSGTREPERSFMISIILPSQDVGQTKAEDIQKAFTIAIDDVNNRSQDSPVRLSNNFTLDCCISRNADNTSTAIGGFFACTYDIRQGPVAVIAPFNRHYTRLLVQLANADEIPIISSAFSRDDVADALFESTENFFSMTPKNLFGGSEVFDGSILSWFQWNAVALLYSDTDSSRNAIIQLQSFAQFGEYRILVEKRIPPVSANTSAFNDSVTEAVESIRGSEAYVIVTSLEESVQVYHTVFSKAKEQKIVNKDTAWICLSLPRQSFFRKSPLYEETMAVMEGVLGTQTNTSTDENHWKVNAHIQNNSILARTYDAVWAIASAIDDGLAKNFSFEFSDNQNGLNYLKDGIKFQQQLKKVVFGGVSGHVRFQWDGTIQPRFDIVNIVKETENSNSNTTEFNFVRVFRWSKQSKLTESKDIPRWYGGEVCRPNGTFDPCRRKLRVLVPSQYPPYIRHHAKRNENDRFTGWAVDVFQYIIKGCINKYEFEESNKTWLEMLKELRRQDTMYDMVLAPIPMTAERLTGIIFTRNIRTISIRPLVLRKIGSSRGMWDFIAPFSWTVWIGVVVGFILIGFVIHVLERNRRQFPDGIPGLFDSVFYSFSSLTYTQDQDAVISLPGRLFVIIVCFVVLILTSCFTANLTVFVLKTDHQLAYNTIEELVDLPVGVLKANSMGEYLRASASINDGHTFQKIYQFDNASQIEKGLRNGSIKAFVDDEGALAILESQTTSCQLAVMSATYRTAHTAFALRNSKPHQELVKKFNYRILAAWDEEYFDDLEQRYFHEATAHSRCRERDFSGSNKPLELTHLGGVFILICAIATFCLTGSGVLTILRKYGVLRYDLGNAKPGVHATAQLIKRAVDTVATGSLATTPSGSKVNLNSHTVDNYGHRLPHNVSPLALNGSPSQYRRRKEYDGFSNRLPAIVRNENDRTEEVYLESKNPLPDIQT